MPSARSGVGSTDRCSTGQCKAEVGSAGGQDTDLGQLADVPCLDGADRVDRHQDPVVVFTAVINRRARTVREVAASDDNCVHAQIGEMPVQPGAMECAPSRFPDRPFVFIELLNLTR